MKVQPYLNFDGRCEEAIEFYRTALGAQVNVMMRMSDAPPSEDACAVAPGTENKVMHASFTVGETELLASDCGCTGNAAFQGVSLALTAPDVAGAQGIFAALSEGGQVQMPMSPTFFSPSFGVVVDKFGLSWSIVAAG